ncbi:hypothetical protein Y032_0062g3350 [Ancylostoma ceylanicum]|uniref:G-protein coupled receptors family 1 profile domain-containing protein n=1 Tax=Ancylostoma ceylanicum TaxID=53326 RepID=A0A016U2B6_9BILA|nr:hypothetical protein Y032_0062g3350 [Ancylostoma ceylanicum]
MHYWLTWREGLGSDTSNRRNESMVSQIAEICVTTLAVILCLIGLFGNLSLLAATITYKELHHKICYMVAVLTSLHVVCLFCELYLEALQLRFRATTRDECFHHTFVYIFAMIAQSVMFLMLSLDIMFAVVIPLRHRIFTTLPYVFYMCLPPFLIGAATVISINLGMSNEAIEFCTPVQAFPRKMGWMTYMVNGLNVAAFVVNLVVFFAVKSRHQSPVMRDSVKNSKISCSDDVRVRQ